jgi:hypothetical protein
VLSRNERELDDMATGLAGDREDDTAELFVPGRRQ